MVEKAYAWAIGAVLDEHSHHKHKILREYFFQYLAVRCVNPHQSKFRLAVGTIGEDRDGVISSFETIHPTRARPLRHRLDPCAARLVRQRWSSLQRAER
ncbi:MAG: hypothetical protein B7Y99_03590 [Caulobacterales bacterium 32-69-10]|nr:MAG: hypothetical protein B7Y99_03590 [Caulobacterales bacterium 32-69-10]